MLFNKVAMRPGSVTTVAALSNGQLLYGLSGNPAACFVGFELFVKPIIYKWCLKENPFPVFAEAKLTHDFQKPIHSHDLLEHHLISLAAS